MNEDVPEFPSSAETVNSSLSVPVNKHLTGFTIISITRKHTSAKAGTDHHCKMSLYTLSINGKVSWKIVQDPKKSRSSPKANQFVLSACDSSLTIASKSVHNFLDILHTDTHRHTDHYKNITSLTE